MSNAIKADGAWPLAGGQRPPTYRCAAPESAGGRCPPAIADSASHRCWLITIVVVALFASPISAQSWPILFSDAAESSGMKKALDGMMGHGGAIADVNGDGLPDLFAGGFCDRPNAEYGAAGKPVPTRLLMHKKGHFFEPVEEEAITFPHQRRGLC